MTQDLEHEPNGQKFRRAARLRPQGVEYLSRPPTVLPAIIDPVGAFSGSALPWPSVTVGDPQRHRTTDRGIDDDLFLLMPREVIACGTVNEIPWAIQGYVTAPGPNAKWWHHGPLGPELEFLLGTDGSFGGVEVAARIPDGTDFTSAVSFFGASPEIVAWVGVASERTDHLEVQLDDGSTRRVELSEGPEGFPRFFWFFPPRGAEGEVVAVDVGGAEIQREHLLERDVSPDANAGTSVNPFSYAAGSPPPGWPEDTTEYVPGEGPRWKEDFCLHVAGFPIFVLPPEQWEGYAMLSGMGSTGREHEVTDVRFVYLDAIPDPRHGLGVHCRHLDEHSSRRRESREEDIGVWLPGGSIDKDEMDFLSRFLPRAEVDRLILRPVVDVGPRRCLGRAAIDLHGETSAERWEYMDHPNLRVARMPLPGVDVTVLGWSISEERLLSFASRLERLELGSDLLKRMHSAVTESKAAFHLLAD
jgi:hypothetical protein